MAFDHNLPKAARRNLEAADTLEQGKRRDVAGYLYGIAAECAVKHMVISLVIAPKHDKDAILYAHFPELRTRLRDALNGRKAQSLLFITDDRFMNNCGVAMRYADAQQIRSHWVDQWRDQARYVVNAMDASP